MKKITLLLGLLAISFLVITGCDSKDLKLNGESTLEIDKDSADFMVVNDTLVSTGASFTLKNNLDTEINYGGEYTIERKENDKWYKIKPIQNMNFDLPATTLNALETYELFISWNSIYGKLPEGKYRMIKNINYTINSKNVNAYISAEFEIK